MGCNAQAQVPSPGERRYMIIYIITRINGYITIKGINNLKGRIANV
jgi:hypothetical protein